jgi:hypothetical protein
MACSQVAHGSELCPKLGQSELVKLARQRGPLKLVFFASWCGECLHHLQAANGKNTLLIATFDEKPAVERVIRKIAPNSDCFTDDGLSTLFKVEAVPTTVDYR